MSRQIKTLIIDGQDVSAAAEQTIRPLCVGRRNWLHATRLN